MFLCVHYCAFAFVYAGLCFVLLVCSCGWSSHVFVCLAARQHYSSQNSIAATLQQHEPFHENKRQEKAQSAFAERIGRTMLKDVQTTVEQFIEDVRRERAKETEQLTEKRALVRIHESRETRQRRQQRR